MATVSLCHVRVTGNVNKRKRQYKADYFLISKFRPQQGIYVRQHTQSEMTIAAGTPALVFVRKIFQQNAAVMCACAHIAAGFKHMLAMRTKRPKEKNP